MSAVITLCLANVRKKKVHNGLIGLLILLSTLLLATSVLVIMNTSDLYSEMHSRTNGSHEMLTLGDQLHDPQQIYQWWGEQEGITTTDMLPFRMLTGLFPVGKELSASLSSLSLYMMKTPPRPFAVDELIFAEGSESTVPEKGTIWLPTSIAYLYGIEVGDRFAFVSGNDQFELRVSAVVVDMPFGAPFPTSARLWMNPQDYNEQLRSVEDNEQVMIGLRFDQYDQSPVYWQRLQQELGQPYLESKISFEEMSSFYLVMNKVIGFIMIFLGIVMVLVALFTIGFTISDDILSNYKTIGVIKALGLPSRKMISIYFMQYTLITLAAIIPGLAASQWISRVIVESALSSLKTGSVEGSWPAQLITIVVGVFVLILVIGCVLVYSNRARLVQPMQAIRYGMSEHDNSRLNKRLNSKAYSRVSFDRAPFLFVMGLRNIRKNKKASILVTFLAAILSAVLVLGFVLLYSISNIKQTSPLWGYDASDIYVQIINDSSFSREKFDDRVAEDSRIQNIGWTGYAFGVISSTAGAGGLQSNTETMNFQVNVMDGSFDEFGFATLRGKNPQHKNEIAIGVNVAKQLDKELGDVLEIYILGHKHILTVTGIYQALANQSFSARVTTEVVKVSHPDYNDYYLGYMNLIDGEAVDPIVQELNTAYRGSLSVLSVKQAVDDTFTQAVASLILPMSIMGLLFTGVTIIIIYSIQRINIKKESKTYGIYKSLGLTSFQIRVSVTLGIMALAGIGAIIGIIVGVYLLPVILGSIFIEYGITKLPLLFHFGGIIAFACVTVVAAGLGSWTSSRLIATRSTQILVIE